VEGQIYLDAFSNGSCKITWLLVLNPSHLKITDLYANMAHLFADFETFPPALSAIVVPERLVSGLVGGHQVRMES